MYLINAETHELHEFAGDNIPPYVILSHTWGEEEVSLQEMLNHTGQDKAGFQKITQCCLQAKRDGFAYAWVDTCCIDKKSSAELSEAINSMYEWYEKSQICYVYLADTIGGFYKADRSSSRWFTRGWTLQELLAPRHVEFYDQNWDDIGTRIGMVSELSKITGINRPVLCGANPRHCFVSERFSWAAGRRTTRPEDRAYSLLGLFNINMPLLYGEGQMAFQRLQKKIMKSTDDRTVLAWLGSRLEQEDSNHTLTGALATSPDDFEGSGDIFMDRDPSVVYNWPPLITDRIVTLDLPSVEIPYSDKINMTLVDLGCKRTPDSSVYLRLFAEKYRAGSLLTLKDQFREDNKFVRKSIQVTRHAIPPPNRIPLSFHFSAIRGCNSPAESEFHMEVRYFGSTEEEENNGTPQDHTNVIMYSDYETFNAASLNDFPTVHSLIIPHGKGDNQVLLRPDSGGTLIYDDAPEQGIAYTVCMLVLRIRARGDDDRMHALCTVVLGALHEPTNRPWCIIQPPVSKSNGNVSDDDEFFKLRVKGCYAGDDTPDRCSTLVTSPSGEVLKVNVALKSRPSDHREERGKAHLCYNVLVSATLLDEFGIYEFLAKDSGVPKHGFGFECFSDPEEQERASKRRRATHSGVTRVKG